MAGDEDGHQKSPKSLLFCLSDLPDEILLHVLSFLPTKSVVATCLLSRRWQHLWNHAPDLQLDESQFNRRRKKFIKFAERALGVRGESSLVSFSLSCKVKNDDFRIRTWITSAIQCNVERLSLHFRASRLLFSLPTCIFECQTLVKLDMETNGRIVNLPSSRVCLPRLKHLRLKRFGFVDNKSTEDLLSHPLLEELIISDCHWDERIRTVNVNSPKLQSLSIDDFCDRSSFSEDRQVCFVGDNLKSFWYAGTFAPTHYCISGSTMQLREVQILAQFRCPAASKSYCKLIKCLSVVQNLTLSKDAVDAFDDLVPYPKMQTFIPVFEHVTLLNLAYDELIEINDEWLNVIFERCPHLEQLNIKPALMAFGPLKPIPSNFLMNLKKITLHSYDPGWDDGSINVLLCSAPVLEEMVIYWFERSSSWNASQISRVEELERYLNWRSKASEKCRISLILKIF